MKLKTPSAPFSPVFVTGESITIDTEGKVLVLPTGNPTILPSFNEYTLNSNRLTIAESPFGGIKGFGSPDYCPGTLNIISGDGIYLTDVNGQNSTKTLTAGKLAELGHLTVDTATHTITEEFVLRNDSEGTDVQVIDDCSSVDGWITSLGAGTFSVENGLKFVGKTNVAGHCVFDKAISADLSSKSFIKIVFKSTLAGGFYFKLTDGMGNYKMWSLNSRFSLVENVATTFVLPLKAPQGTTGALPPSVSGNVDFSNITGVRVGVSTSSPDSDIETLLNCIKACNGAWAQVEVAVPDTLTTDITSIACYKPANVAYLTADTWAYTISNRTCYMDNTLGSDIDGVITLYGSSIAPYPLNTRNTTNNRLLGGSGAGTLTYSSNYGTQKRIGFAILMPPSDNGRTGINQCRLKLVTYYDDENGSTVPDLSGNGNTGILTGGVTKLNEGGLKFDGSTGYVDFGDKELFDIGLSDFRVELKIKTTMSGSTAYIIDKYTGWAIQLSATGKIVAFMYYGSTLLNQTSNTSVNDGIEHTVIWNLDRDGYSTITIDGISDAGNVDVSSFSSTDLQSVQKMSLGVRSAGLVSYLNGIITSVYIYKGQNKVLEISSTVQNMGATTYEFANSTNASYGLQNISLPWIALYDPAGSLIDFYLFTHRPKNLSFKRNESGQIHELTLYPGNGLLYHGQIHYSDLTRDTDSNDIPDCLEASLEGSLSKFLQSYGMVI